MRSYLVLYDGLIKHKKNYISSVSQFLRNHTTEIELH